MFPWIRFHPFHPFCVFQPLEDRTEFVLYNKLLDHESFVSWPDIDRTQSIAESPTLRRQCCDVTALRRLLSSETEDGPEQREALLSALVQRTIDPDTSVFSVTRCRL